MVTRSRGDSGTREKARLTCKVPADLLRQLKHEAIDRDMTLGALVEEAFATRARRVHRESKN